MAKDKKSRSGNLNSSAKRIVGEATGDDEREEPLGKNPAAVGLGRKGGLKDGKAREKSCPRTDAIRSPGRLPANVGD